MIPIKRPAAALGAAALLAFSLTACGSDASDAPTDASEEDFCGVFEDAYKPIIEAGFEPSEDDWEKFQDAIEDLADVGTPEDMTDDEREGFEVFVEAVDEADYDDVKGDSDFGVSGDDEDKAEKFFAYVSETCPEAFGVPTDLPTGIPTDLTDLPTDLTDIPTDLLSDLSDLPSDFATDLETE